MIMEYEINIILDYHTNEIVKMQMVNCPYRSKKKAKEGLIKTFTKLQKEIHHGMF